MSLGIRTQHRRVHSCIAGTGVVIAAGVAEDPPAPYGSAIHIISAGVMPSRRYTTY